MQTAVRESLVLSPFGPGRFNGIGDYAWQLTRALAERSGRPAALVVRQGADGPVIAGDDVAASHGVAIEGMRSWRDLLTPEWIARGRAAADVFVQYFPQAYVAADFRPLTTWLRARREAGLPVVVMLHEYWPHLGPSPRRVINYWSSRRALRELVSVSSAMIVSQPYSLEELVRSSIVPRELIHVIPIGSAVPRVVLAPAHVAPGTIPMLVMFGQPAMMNGRVVAELAEWLSATPSPARLWWFSRSDDELRTWWKKTIGGQPDVVTLRGGVPAGELSESLQQANLALALYADGASTRRSSLAALLGHGLPVVALEGRYTDARLRESGAFTFVSPDEPESFPRAVDSLLADPSRQAVMRAAANMLSTTHLGWPVIAAEYLSLEQTQ